jgi:uncharacterized surface protein with fasciclin (FAS1) repeats
MTLRATLATAAGLAIAASLPAAAQDAQADGNELLTLLEEQGNYSTLLQALEASDATWFTEEEMSYTLFAPTDEAFDKLPEGVLDALLQEENKPLLNAIIEGHVVPEQALAADDLTPVKTLDPAAGEPLPVAVENGNARIGEATVTEANLATDYGVIHGIDTVLAPEIVVDAAKYRGIWPEDDASGD